MPTYLHPIMPQHTHHNMPPHIYSSIPPHQVCLCSYCTSTPMYAPCVVPHYPHIPPLLRYTKQLHFMSVLVILQLSKLFIIVFCNVYVLYTYFGMLNFEETFRENCIDAIDASISRNKYLATFLKETSFDI